MSVVMIVDSSKPGLVMSSEIFKDKLPGSTILIAESGEECLSLLATNKPDICLIDFDLCDADGISLAQNMRRTYKGPIIITAYPDKIVEEAISSELFGYHDYGAWLSKPIKGKELAMRIDQFIIEKHRLEKRYSTEIDSMVVGKGLGRGKRAPKSEAQIINISFGGVCVKLIDKLSLKKLDEMTLTLSRTNAKSEKKTAVESFDKFKCEVCWVNKKNDTVGLSFNKLNKKQKSNLIEIIKDSGNDKIEKRVS